MAMRHYCVRLENETRARLVAYAARRGVTLSQALREALAVGLDVQDKTRVFQDAPGWTQATLNV